METSPSDTLDSLDLPVAGTLSPRDGNDAAWGAVYAIGFNVAGLTAAEMLPISLLTPMAADLHVSEGVAGQAVTATALVALVASLVIPIATRGLDRRKLLFCLSAFQVVSNLLVALAPNLAVLLLGRMLLGLSLGGFWALSAALAIRLVPHRFVPRAFSIIFGGVSVATVAAAPIGSYIGNLIGWRGVFLAASLMAMLALVWQFATLPSIPPRGQTRLATLFHVLRRSSVGLGMTGVILVFTGHFAFFTYLRPFVEDVTHVDVNGVSAILLAFGIGSFVGNSIGGWLLDKSLRLTLAIVPLLMSVMAAIAVLFGASAFVVSTLVALWGCAFGTIPVGWSTWLTRTIPDEAESGGGLLVAAIQIAVTMGAAVGGIIFDRNGASAVFTASGVILLAAALTIMTALKPPPVRITIG